MSFDPKQPGDWSGESGSKPKRRDPVLDLFSSSESLELEPIDDDEDDIVPLKAVESEKVLAEPAEEKPGPRSSGQKRDPVERSGRRDQKPAAAKPASRDPAPAPVAETAPASKPPATSHWAKLAGMLGIGGKAARDSKEAEPAQVAAETPRGAESKREPKRQTEQPGTRPSAPAPRKTVEPRQPVAAESEIAWEPPARHSEPVESASAQIPEPVAEEDENEDGSRFLDGDEYVEFEIEELDPEGKLSLSKGAVSLDDPSKDKDREPSSRRDAPRREPRRRESSPRDPASRDSSRTGDGNRSGRNRPERPRPDRPQRTEGSFAEGLADDSAETSTPQRRNPRGTQRDDGPESESRRRPEPDNLDSCPEVARTVADRDADDPDRPRKRRRRRGRGRGADGAKTAAGPDGNPEAIQDGSDPRDIDPRDVESGEIDPADELPSAKGPRPPHRQGERTNSNRSRNKNRNRDDDGPDDDSGDGDERSRKTVTTWSTAISTMIDRNMASRKGRPSGGNRGGGGNRPRGNSGPRRR